MEPAISGQGGHGRTLRVAGVVAVGFNLSDDEALTALADWYGRCTPAWSAKELLRKIREARRTTNKESGYLTAA